jgi:heat shock protein HslJ
VNDRRQLALILALSTIGFVFIMAIAINSSDDDVGVLDGDWTVQTLISEGEETLVVDGTTLTATFDAAALTGSAGCNNFTGSYESDGASLTVGPLASTQMFCADPVGAMDQEFAYLTILTEAESYSITADSLTIHAVDGRQVTLTRN